MHRVTMTHEHHEGCVGGPHVAEVEGPYRAVVCRGCGVPVEVSYPVGPADEPADPALIAFALKQTARLNPQ